MSVIAKLCVACVVLLIKVSSAPTSMDPVCSSMIESVMQGFHDCVFAGGDHKNLTREDFDQALQDNIVCVVRTAQSISDDFSFFVEDCKEKTENILNEKSARCACREVEELCVDEIKYNEDEDDVENIEHDLSATFK